MNWPLLKKTTGYIILLLLIIPTIYCSRAPVEFNVSSLEGEWFGRWHWNRYSDTVDIKIIPVKRLTPGEKPEPVMLRCEIHAGMNAMPDEKIVYDFKVESQKELSGILSTSTGKINLTEGRKIVINLIQYPAVGNLKATLVFSGDTLKGTFYSNVAEAYLEGMPDYKNPENEQGKVTLNRK